SWRNRQTHVQSLFSLLEASSHQQCSNIHIIRVIIGPSTCIRQPECFFSRRRRSIICWKSIISNRKSSYYICTVRVLRGISWYHFLYRTRFITICGGESKRKYWFSRLRRV